MSEASRIPIKPLGIGEVALRVNDLRRSIAFYCETLARLHLLGPIFAIFAGLFAGKPLYPMTRTVWNRL